MKHSPKIWILSLILLSLSVTVISATSITEDTTKSSSTSVQDVPKSGPASAFVASFSTIVVSELGDKTFFIAAIMAMRYNRIAVLSGALLALFLMTAISTGFGTLVTSLVPAFYTHIITTALFFFFGIKLLYDAYNDEGASENHEKSEVETELNELHTKMMEKKSKNDDSGNKSNADSGNKSNAEENNNQDPETGKLARNDADIESAPSKGSPLKTFRISTKLVFWQALTLTFLGEWGDRSQISTIALAANSSAVIVFIGSFLGHCLCTTLAVVGGKYLADKITEKSVNIAGGILFLVFGIHNVLFA